MPVHTQSHTGAMSTDGYYVFTGFSILFNVFFIITTFIIMM